MRAFRVMQSDAEEELQLKKNLRLLKKENSEDLCKSLYRNIIRVVWSRAQNKVNRYRMAVIRENLFKLEERAKVRQRGNF